MTGDQQRKKHATPKPENAEVLEPIFALAGDPIQRTPGRVVVVVVVVVVAAPDICGFVLTRVVFDTKFSSFFEKLGKMHCATVRQNVLYI